MGLSGLDLNWGWAFDRLLGCRALGRWGFPDVLFGVLLNPKP